MMSHVRTMQLFCAVLLVSFAAVGTASADTKTVGCFGSPTGSSYDYDSIQAALDALHSISNRGHEVQIWGTCTEDVRVRDFEYLTLNGNKDARIVDLLDAQSTPALQITNSNVVAVNNLTIQGNDEIPVSMRFQSLPAV